MIPKTEGGEWEEGKAKLENPTELKAPAPVPVLLISA